MEEEEKKNDSASNVNTKSLKPSNSHNGKPLKPLVGKLKNLRVSNGKKLRAKQRVLLQRNKPGEMRRRLNGLGWRRKKG